eukprot:1925071-Pleurochrysis_carterae.AAC.2
MSCTTPSSRARARPRTTLLTGVDNLLARAYHDGFARYRDAARAPGSSIGDCAKNDAYSRYDTGEPHPFDGGRCIASARTLSSRRMAARLTTIVRAAAVQQWDRWVAEAKEDLELEPNREHHADELFPEPLPMHPDDEEPSGSFSSDSDVQPSD